jgi:osmotically-inducible protein OsmY
MNPMIRTLLTLTLALPLCFATVSMPLTASTTHRSAAHGPTPSDAQIDATIRTKLAKSKIGKEGFHYKVLHGIVTWEGNTDVAQHKGSATRMAKSAGAVQVVNNIQVSAKGKAKAMATLKKASIKTS